MQQQLFYTVCLVLLVSIGRAQSNYQFGFLPAMNLNTKLPKDMKLNLKVESRQELKAGEFAMDNDFAYKYILTDFAMVVAKKINLRQSLAGGYQFRIREGRINHRIIQQYIFTKRFESVKLSHRFSADQTFSETKDTEIRLRYRLASEIPLDGQSVDPREFYFKVSNEYLNAWQGSNYDLEIRVTPFWGYKWTNKTQIELGLDYRINSFLEKETSQRFWIGLNWYQTI